MAIGKDAPALRRGRVATASSLGLAVLALSVWAAPSGAVVANIGGHAYGLTPIRGVNPASLPSVQRARRASGVSATGPIPYDKTNQLTYHGGPVMHSVTTHVVYWDPNGEFTATTKSIVKKFFTDVAHDSGLASNVFPIAGQYGDRTGHTVYSSTFAGEATDATAFPASGCTIPSGTGIDAGPPYTHCLTDEQLQTELKAFVEKEHLPKGPTQQYFVLFPHKVAVCFTKTTECSNNVFCAYHSSIEGGSSNEIIYSDIPFTLLDSGHVKECQFDGLKTSEIQNPNGDTAGTNENTRYADVALKYTSHEYTEAATDPLGNAWWEEPSGQENGDKCNFTGSGSGFGEDPNAFLPTLGGSAVSGTLFDQSINGDSFYIQSEWDNAVKACLMKPAALTAAGFTAAPTSGVAGAPVKFSGFATDPYGGLGFVWKFGDGTESAAASPEHVYAAPGSYEVTMTPKDEFTASTTAPVVHAIVLADEQPTASLSLSPNPATAGSPVSFNGGASSDPDGSIVSYSWNFGDASAAEGGAAPSHTYGAAGTYTVTLAATDSAGLTATTTQSVTVNAAPVVIAKVTPTAPVPNSSFGALSASLNQTTGLLTFTESVGDPGTFSWLLTFQNGKFGVFAASTSRCKKGYVKLNGKCRPSKIVYAKGSKVVAAAGTLTFTIKPSRSALTALKNALKRKKGLPVTITLTYQSSRGGSPVAHTQSLTIKPKKK
jgi:PKD repeat protein